MTTREKRVPATVLHRTLESFEIYPMLAKLRHPACVVADAPVLAMLRTLGPAHGALLVLPEEVTKARFPTAPPGPYFVVTAGNELHLKQRLRVLLRGRGVQAEIYGALHDLTPMSLTDNWKLEPGGMEVKWESLTQNKALVIACTPRSGSQYLARTLDAQGIGAPREHIRPGVVALLEKLGDARVGRLDFIPWFASLVHQGRRNGVFGTKLISHFLKDMETHLTPAEWATLCRFIDGSCLVYLLRSNKLMQALSRDRAKSTKQYHLFDESRRDKYLEASQAWSYDFTRISQELRRLAAEETYLFGVLRQLRPGLDLTYVPYERMDAAALVDTLTVKLGMRKPQRQTELPTNILRDERTEEFAARFMQDYRTAYRTTDTATHLPHVMQFDAAKGALIRRVEPDGMDAGAA